MNDEPASGSLSTLMEPFYLKVFLTKLNNISDIYPYIYEKFRVDI
ncbi:hypothetical protein RE474_11915 [Methanolobus sediminis]|uniref:Uncharacterized protein n=1 Tax=Methanolobus sediminis TaxID=3072978 RepID=A0AA51UJM9_9EURY|nr:hypothetical protein [Methanolobus sediminis]WMW24772.1 hypothetical protein RE474_11915 [Methanolobus sediminis]